MDDNALKLWDQIKHFSYNEFDDPTSPGSGINMNIEFVKLIDQIRDRINYPLHIDSGFRTPEHNAQVGGKVNSAHLKGVACDLLVPDSLTRYSVLKSAFELGFKRIGVGDTFIHLDMDYDITMPQNVVWLYPTKTKG